MDQDKVFAILNIAERIIYTEILYSISLPPHILNKYKSLKDSVLSSTDFSFKKFSTIFTPRVAQDISEIHSGAMKQVLAAFAQIEKKVSLIIESSEYTENTIKSYNYYSTDQLEHFAIRNGDFSQEINETEDRINQSLNIISDLVCYYNRNLKTLDEELRNCRSSIRHDGQYDSVTRENECLKEEIKRLQHNWSEELENARVQWSQGLDKIQFTYESNMKHLTDSHNEQLRSLKQTNHEKLQKLKTSSAENEKKLLEKLESLTSDQSEVLNKLNNKIIFLSSKNNEDSFFIEKVSNKIDEIFEKAFFEQKPGNYKNIQDRILEKLEELEMNILNQQKNQSYDSRSNSNNLKKKLVENSAVVKEFEEARNKLVKHFSDSPRKGFEVHPNTTRY